MATDAATPPRPAAFERAPAASLTQRASLNVAASLLDYAAKPVLGKLAISPERFTAAAVAFTLAGTWAMLRFIRRRWTRADEAASERQ